jgi:hypothetical protein
MFQWILSVHSSSQRLQQLTHSALEFEASKEEECEFSMFPDRSESLLLAFQGRNIRR